MKKNQFTIKVEESQFTKKIEDAILLMKEVDWGRNWLMDNASS